MFIEIIGIIVLFGKRPEDLIDFVIELDMLSEFFFQNVIERHNVAMSDENVSF